MEKKQSNLPGSWPKNDTPLSKTPIQDPHHPENPLESPPPTNLNQANPSDEPPSPEPSSRQGSAQAETQNPPPAQNPLPAQGATQPRPATVAARPPPPAIPSAESIAQSRAETSWSEMTRVLIPLHVL